MVEGPTKTKAGHRTVTLPCHVITELEEHRTAYASTGLIFTSEEGTQVRMNNLRRRQWTSAVERAGLPGLTFHDMRHTAVSLWVAALRQIPRWRSGPATVRRPSPRAVTPTCSRSTVRAGRPLGRVHRRLNSHAGGRGGPISPF